MNNVVNVSSEMELLPILKPLILKILAEQNSTKSSPTNNNGKALAQNQEANVNIRAKELELIERVIRLEEQGNAIRQDINDVRQDMKDLRQDMKDLHQDMDKRFDKVYE